MGNRQDREYLERLVSIRKETGLNQEQFFFKHLKDAKKTIKTNSSAQNYMKNIESGKDQLTVPELKIYAELANCSIDQIVYGDNISDKKPKEISCADVIAMLDILRKEGAIELELSQKTKKVYWGKDGLLQSLPNELPVESVSIWVENDVLSFELKQYMQVISTEKINTLSADVSDKLLKLWIDDMQKRKNTVKGTKEGLSVTDSQKEAYMFGHR